MRPRLGARGLGLEARRAKRGALAPAAIVAGALLTGALAAQTPTGAPTTGVPGDWPTVGATAQRDGWLRADPYISLDEMKKGGFDLQWKLQLEWPRVATRFTGGAAVGGRKPLTFYSDSAGRVWAIDNDTGFDFWHRSLTPAAAAGCAAPLSAGITKWTALIAPTTGAAKGGGFGAAVRPAYSSVVSEPGAGVADLIMTPRGGGARGAAPAPPAGARGAATPAPATPAAAPTPAGSGRAGNEAPAAVPARTGGAGGGGRVGGGRGASGVFALAPDGVLHILGENSGIDVQKPVPFLKPNADTRGLSVVANVAYVLTSNRCAGSENGVAAVDLSSEGKDVTFWQTGGGAPVGMPAFGQDGTVYVAVSSGAVTPGGYANAIVALEPRTLKVKDWFTQPDARFTSSPIVARIGERDVLVAPTATGRVLLLESASLGGADHRTPAFASPAYAAIAPSSTATTYRDGAGTAWVLLPIAGRPAATAAAMLSNGVVSSGAILALKVAEAASTLSLEPAWVSRDLVAPWSPVVVNGVLFALASGTRAPAAASVPAVLYALDPLTGKALWDSGKAMTTSAGTGALVTGNSQIHVTTPAGMVYAFGFAMERR